MHFTVVFRGSESVDLSYGLVFIPCPCWVKGNDTVINLNPSTPLLEPGSVARLIDHENLRSLLAIDTQQCTIVVHPEGHGSATDLAQVRSELESAGFAVCVISP